MRILILAASLPYPPHQGGALRTYGILYGLHQAGHDITLLSFHDGDVQPADTPLAGSCSRIETVLPPVRSKADRLRDLLLTGEPDIARRLYSDAFRARLLQLLAETRFDLILFEGIEVACYLPLVRQMGVTAKLCYDAFNAEAALQQVIFRVDLGDPKRWPAAAYSLVQSRRIARFERLLCQQADAVIAVSDEDAAILKQMCPNQPVPVVNNGIFVDDYACAGQQLDLGEHVMVFTGKMDYRPNVDAITWFADSILPRVQEQLPDARLYIVGQKPHPRVEQLRGRRNVEVTGWVRDVRPFLHAAGVYVAPLRMGSGTRLKILEAMAAGCAVVATPVAVSGMRDDVKNVAIITDQPDAFAAAVIGLLQDPQRRQQTGQAAQQYVKQRYDWPVLIPRLLAIFKELGLE
ncbi:MAG: glycosyltransferase [Chloroflexi bacterium]|nr:glycosyltransferase [Chloroflexota bacterium]